jgi:ParB family chromosome partitioning protein
MPIDIENKTALPEYQSVYIGSIEVWQEANVRHSQVTAGIDELAESIKQIGLQQPIVVQEVAPNKYKLIAGQRRFLALQKIGQKFVPVKVVKGLDMAQAMVASLAENLHRRPVDERDLADACEFLLEVYGSAKEASRILGISTPTFNKYLGYKAVPNELKDMVAQKKITVSDAKRLAEINDISKAVEFGNLISKLAKVDKDKYFAALLEDTSSPLPVIEARAKHYKPRDKITIHLPESYANALQKASTASEKEPEAIAQNAVMQWLDVHGYTGT